jgi:hypothetical protein
VAFAGSVSVGAVSAGYAPRAKSVVSLPADHGAGRERFLFTEPYRFFGGYQDNAEVLAIGPREMASCDSVRRRKSSALLLQ